MNQNEYASGLISLFAEVSEQLNAYAQALRRESIYKTVTTGSDLRAYNTGWRLEKWVEFLLNAETGLCACLWLELGFQSGNWIISGSLSVSHIDYHFEMQSLKATTLEEVKACLTRMALDLTEAAKNNESFKVEIRKHSA